MTKQDVLDALDEYEQNPHGVYCDAPCDAAEFLGLDEGEYDIDWLREQVEQS